MSNNRFLSKLAAMSKVRGEAKRRTGVYTSVHEDSSIASTKQFAIAVEFGKKSKGFTLLEILIALFIFSIVSMIMVSALHTVFNSQSVTEKHAAALTKLQIAFLLMSHDLEQTVNRPVTNAKGLVENAFIGTPNTITFTHAGFANPLGNMLSSTLQRTQYSLNNEHFIRSIWPVLDQTQKTLPSHRILLHNITALRFDYLDSLGKFQNNWPQSNQPQAIFPRAVRVTMTLKNRGTLSQLYLIPAQTEQSLTTATQTPTGQSHASH